MRVMVDLVCLAERAAGTAGRRARVAVTPGRVEHVEPDAAGGEGVVRRRVVRGVRAVDRGVRVHPVLTARGGGGRGLWPVGDEGRVQAVIAADGEVRDALARDRPVRRAEHRADVDPGLVEVAVCGLRAAGIGDVTCRHHELGTARGDLRVHVRLVLVDRSSGVVAAVGRVAPVAEHAERQRRRAGRRRRVVNCGDGLVPSRSLAMPTGVGDAVAVAWSRR